MLVKLQQVSDSGNYSNSTSNNNNHNNMSYHQQNWQPDRWQQPSSGPGYATMGSMAYEPPMLPSTNTMQRTAMTPMTPQYSLPSFAEGPVTPMSTSPYAGHGQYGDYQTYSYQQHTASYSDQMPLRHSQRPLAPPTPPLEDDHGMRHQAMRADYAIRTTERRSMSRSVSVGMSDTTSSDSQVNKKRRQKFVKEDGKTLLYQSAKPIDKVLQVAAQKLEQLKLEEESAASTPESMASPATEEGNGRRRVKKDKICHVCGHACSQKAQLETHMRAHTGEKPYQCNLCHKRVSQPGNLKAHMKTHSQAKPYPCPYDGCPLVFAANGGRKVHIRNKHPASGVPPPKMDCPMPKCSRSFTTIGNMKVHIDKFHVDLLQEYLAKLEDYDSSKTFPPAEAKILETLVRIYANSNCGIKGRGVLDEETKALNNQLRERRQASSQAMSTNLGASPVTSEYHSIYYNQHDQQHYASRPPPEMQIHQSPAYMQIPTHPSQPIFHGLPEPVQQYTMQQWSSSPYH